MLSTLLETLTTSSGYLLSSGDFNFHMDVDTDTDANNFKDLLESAGLAQHVKGPTHRSGHTLDLIIDRQNDTVLSSFTTLMDHHPVVCPMAFAKPPASKSQFIQRHLEDAVDLDALKADILNFPLGGKLQDGDPDSLVQLRKIIERHVPEESRIITLRPNAPWFDSELRKRESLQDIRVGDS